MRKVILPLLALSLFAAVAHADNVGSSFGALMTAQSLPQGQTVIGGRLGLADATSMYATLGYGFSNMADGRIKLGIVGDDLNESELTLGADAKWQIWRSFDMNSVGQVNRTKQPFDLAIGPFAEWFRADFRAGVMSGNMDATQLGVQVVGSYPVLMDNGNGGILSPYARVNARSEWVSVNASGAGTTINDGDSHLAAGLNTGMAWRPHASPVSMYGELQFDGNNGVFFGLDYVLGRTR